MRIAYLLLQFPVLTQTFIVNEITELLDQGHEVFVFSATHPKSKVWQPQIEDYDLIARTYYLPVFANITHGLPDSDGYPDLLRDSLEATRLGARILEEVADITAASHFGKLAEKLHIDLIHSHFYGSASTLAALTARRAGIPFTFTCHALDIFVGPDPEVMRRHFDAASRIITISLYNKEYLKGLTDVADDKIAIVRACSDIRRFIDVRRRDRGDCIVSLGRLVEKKGLKYAIEAFARVAPDFPALRYRILGDGPLHDELNGLAQELGVAERIEFKGAVSQDEVRAALEEATLMVLPCVHAANGDLDGSPLALQEAMVAGVPVVSTTVASIPELIRTEAEGTLIPPHDSDGLEDAIRRLLTNESARRTMGRIGTARVLECFNIRTEVTKLVAIWREVLTESDANMALLTQT